MLATLLLLLLRAAVADPWAKIQGKGVPPVAFYQLIQCLISISNTRGVVSSPC
jgi:hypothetical protein